MTFSLFTIGFISMLGQVIILREFLVAFYGIELICALAIGVWLLWTGTGAFFFRKSRPSANIIALLFFFLGLAFPGDVLFLRSSRLVFSAVPGAYLSFFRQMVIILTALLPIGIPLGLLFQWAARHFTGEGRSLPAAYAIESAGGLLGGLASTLFFYWGLQNFTLALVCASACLTGPLLYPGLGSSVRRLAAVLLLFLIPLFFLSGPIDRRTSAWNHPGLQAVQDTPYGRITVTKLSDQISVFENDVLLFETQSKEPETFSHLPALQHHGPAIRKMLILGGLDGTIQELVKYRPERIDWVEINRTGVDLILPFLPAEMRQPLLRSPVRLIIADPRTFLKQGDRYDLIVVALGEPVSGQANRFYTKEFFAACASRLAPGGLVALRLRSGENFWTPAMQSRLESIYRALKTIFPEVLILPGDTNVVTASFAPLPKDPEILVAQWQRFGLRTRLVSPPYIRYLYSNDRFFTIQEKLKTGRAPINSDLRPFCYQYTVMIWLSKFFPSMAPIPGPDSGNLSVYGGIGALILAGLFFFLRRSTPWRRVMLAGAAGFLGMLFESVLILYYQVKAGVLYQDIGVLLMSFMAGLALGAQVMERVFSGEVDLQRKIRTWGLGLLMGFSCLAGVAGLLMQRGYGTGLLETVLMLGASGFVVAAVFACASRYGNSNQERSVAPIYGADLLGGCLGALLAGTVLIPFSGLLEAILTAGGVGFLAMILI